MIAYHNTSGELPPLSLVDDFDQSGKRVGLPCGQEFVVKRLDMLLELAQIDVQSNHIGAQHAHFVIQIPIAGLQHSEGRGVSLEDTALAVDAQNPCDPAVYIGTC